MQTRIYCTRSSAQLISKIMTVAILSTGEPYGILHVLPRRDHRCGDVVERFHKRSSEMLADLSV